MVTVGTVGKVVGINSIAGAGVIGNWIFRVLSEVAVRKTHGTYIIIIKYIHRIYNIPFRRRQCCVCYKIEITFAL